MSEKNKILYESRLHWVIFMMPVTLIVGSLLIFIFAYRFYQIGLMLLAVGVGVGITYWFTYKFSIFQILSNGVRIKSGIFVKESTNVPFKSIETIDIRQNVLGSMLNYGTLMIRGSGGSYNYMHHLQDPLACRRHIEANL